MDAWELRSADDLRAAQAFAARMWSVAPFWHPGGLAWDHVANAGYDPDRRTRMWGSSDNVLAIADVAELGHLDVQVDPARSDLVLDVLRWFEGTATRNQLSVSFADHAGFVREALWSSGYLEAPDLPFSLDMRMRPEDVEFVDLPEGYEVKSIDADCVEERVEVHRAAWLPSKLTLDTYRRLMVTWPYREVFDIVAVAPDGTFAACCIGWLDPDTRSAEIEPVGTHPGYRRQGLAQAVVAECIERLGVAGCEEVVIKPRGDDAYPVPRQVYAGLGFETVGRTRTFRKRR
jgi:ribosomal protein S18 acetylase RimI-like enzyme